MDKLRIGIVGTGQRVCYHGGVVFTENSENEDCGDAMVVAALCDTRPERVAHAKAFYEEHLGYEIATYADYQKMYAEAGLDAVYVAGPNDTHRDMTVAAFEHGLHVLTEKPMDVSLARCDEMIAAARKADRILALGMQMHYRVRYHKVRELIEQGVIGKPVMLWCTEYRGPFGGIKDWVWQRERSGGAIVEKNCHHYDILSLWVQSEPTTVYASGSIEKHTMPYGKYPSDIVDNAWVLNDYACGARAMVGVSFLATKGHQREFGVIGTEGRIFFSGQDNEVLHISTNDGASRTFENRAVVRGGLFRDFVDCVRTGEQPLVTAEMGRASLRVPLAAEMSIAEKRVVNVSEVT